MSVLPSGDISEPESELREQRIERLVSEIGQVIRGAPLEIREELRQIASDLLDEETRLLTSNNQQQAKVGKYEPPLNGIARRC